MSHFTPSSPSVSVLMVTHDAERTVRRALESLQNQTLRSFEAIVVDAGSRDATVRLVDALAERDLRIALVRADACSRQEGLQLALERARGTYLTVMDADGWAEPTMLSRLVEKAEDEGLEMVVGGFEVSLAGQGGRVFRLSAVAPSQSFPTQHDFRSAAWRLLGSGQLLPASAKLISRERAEAWGARFDPAAGNDHPFVMACLREVRRIGVLGEVCYHVERAASATRGERFDSGEYGRLEAEYAALLDLYRHWQLDGDAASVEMLQRRYVGMLLHCIERACSSASGMSPHERTRLVAHMIGSDRAQVAASVVGPTTGMARVMLAPIRTRNASLACAQARLASLLRLGPRPEGLTPDAYV